jgi:hypothetical protein
VAAPDAGGMREAIVGLTSEPDYWLNGLRNPYYG